MLLVVWIFNIVTLCVLCFGDGAAFCDRPSCGCVGTSGPTPRNSFLHCVIRVAAIGCCTGGAGLGGAVLHARHVLQARVHLSFFFFRWRQGWVSWPCFLWRLKTGVHTSRSRREAAGSERAAERGWHGWKLLEGPLRSTASPWLSCVALLNGGCRAEISCLGFCCRSFSTGLPTQPALWGLLPKYVVLCFSSLEVERCTLPTMLWHFCFTNFALP